MKGENPLLHLGTGGILMSVKLFLKLQKFYYNLVKELDCKKES
jgi:hypothetical protein